MQVKVIKHRADYDVAMQRLNELLDLEPKEGTDLADELDLLLVVIKAYERATVAPVTIDPIEVILFRMEQMDLSRKDMEQYLGSASKVLEVLSRKRPLSMAMIRKLHKGLGISADILVEDAPRIESKLMNYTLAASA
jgi:HTH-type transcriptional regulator/antitoxin HigA